MNGKLALGLYIALTTILAGLFSLRGIATGLELESLSVAEEAFRNNNFLHLTYHGEPYIFFPISAWLMILSKYVGFPIHAALSILSVVGILELSRRRINDSGLDKQQKTMLFHIEFIIYTLLALRFAFVAHLFLSFLLFLPCYLCAKAKKNPYIYIVLLLAFALSCLCGWGLVFCIIPWCLTIFCKSKHVQYIYPIWHILNILGILFSLYAFFILFFRHTETVQFLYTLTKDNDIIKLALSLFLGTSCILLFISAYQLYLLRKDKNAMRSVILTNCGLIALLLYGFWFTLMFKPLWSYEPIGEKVQQLIKEHSTYRIYACGVDQAEDLDVYVHAPITIIQEQQDLLGINPNSILLFTKESQELFSAFLYGKQWECIGKVNYIYIK